MTALNLEGYGLAFLAVCWWVGRDADAERCLRGLCWSAQQGGGGHGGLRSCDGAAAAWPACLPTTFTLLHGQTQHYCRYNYQKLMSMQTSKPAAGAVGSEVRAQAPWMGAGSRQGAVQRVWQRSDAGARACKHRRRLAATVSPPTCCRRAGATRSPSACSTAAQAAAAALRAAPCRPRSAPPLAPSCSSTAPRDRVERRIMPGLPSPLAVRLARRPCALI